MKIAEVRIKNFRGYGVNPDSKDGFYSFEGLHNSPFIIFNGFNGFGKTSFFEAIEWCLTNTVLRLSYFEDNDSIPSLRNTHYLTFISKDAATREAEVVITFDNGDFIKRTTTSKSLQASDYARDTHFYINQEEVTIDRDELNDSSLKKIFSINFLGQETILDLLKKDKPDERSSKFLNLIDLNILNRIQEKSNSKSFNFGSKIQKKKEEISKKESYKKEAGELLNKLGIQSVPEYIEQVLKEKTALESFIQTLSTPEIQAYFRSKISLQEETLSSCIKLTDIVDKVFKITKERTQKIKEERKNKVEYNNIIHAIALFNKVDKLKSIKSTNIVCLTASQINNARRVKSLNERLKLVHDSSEYLIKTSSDSIWGNYLTRNHSVDYILKNGVDIVMIQKKIRQFETYITLFDELHLNSKDKEERDVINHLRNEIQAELAKVVNDSILIELNRKIKAFCEVEKSSKELIAQKEKSLVVLSQLNTSHIEVLHKASNYIDSQNELNKCPLCLSTDFSSVNANLELNNLDNVTIKGQLLAIIKKQITGGDETIKAAQDEITELKKQLQQAKEKVTKELKTTYLNRIEHIRDNEELLLDAIERVMTNYTIKLESIIGQCNTILSNLNVKIDKYKNEYMAIFNEPYETSNNTIDQALINQESAELSKLIERINKEKDYENKIDSLKLLIKQKSVLEQKATEDTIEIMDAKIKDCEFLIPQLEKWSHLNVASEERKIMEEVSSYDQQIALLTKELENLETEKTIVNTISGNISKKKDEMLQLLFENKLIGHIYREINPHYRFNTITLENKKTGQSNRNYIKSNETNDGVHLNQIFSAAQLNIISLSIFLGMGLPEKSSNFSQLFLDDPIQSMDDMNVLALIDVFRSLVDIPEAKSILLSTHDDNFAQLLKIKMRNKNIKVFDFVSYGDEGPIVSSN